VTPAEYAPIADGETAVAGPRRTAASGAAFRAYLPWPGNFDCGRDLRLGMP